MIGGSYSDLPSLLAEKSGISPAANDETRLSDGSSDGPPGLVDRPAALLLIPGSSMPSGWRIGEEAAFSPLEVDAREGHWRAYERAFNILGYRDVMFLNVSALPFETSDGAKAYFAERLAAVREGNTTESRPYGDEAAFWSLDGRHNFILVRKANVVWTLELERGTFPATWGETLEWFASRTVRRAG